MPSRMHVTLMHNPKAGTEDQRFLERVVAPDFTHTDPWRVLRIMSEFIEGFDALAEVGPAITVFGSARLGEEHPAYAEARKVGQLLAGAGFAHRAHRWLLCEVGNDVERFAKPSRTGAFNKAWRFIGMKCNCR